MRFNVSGTTALYLAQAIVDWINNMDDAIDTFGVKCFASDFWEDSDKLIVLKNKIIDELKAKSYNSYIDFDVYETNRERRRFIDAYLSFAGEKNR